MIMKEKATNPSGHKTTDSGENEELAINVEKYGFELVINSG